MNLKQDKPGWNWYTDDLAKIFFKNSGYLRPDSINAFRIGSFSVNVYVHTIPVNVEDLEYLAVGNFGPGRPTSFNSNTKWTGDAYKFGIYIWKKNGIVILRADGGGTYAYYVDQLDSVKTWSRWAAMMDEASLWDLCITLTKTFHAGEAKARREERQAFVDGRMKKRRRNGQVFVEVASV